MKESRSQVRHNTLWAMSLAAVLCCGHMLAIGEENVLRIFWDQKLNKCGFKDKAGKVIVESKYDAARYINERLWAFAVGGKFYAIMEQQRPYLETYSYKNGKWGNVIGGKWGFLDMTGKVVAEPQFEEVGNCFEDLIAVKQKGKWGFLDKDGKVAIQPRFDCFMGCTRKGLAAVGIGNKNFYVDKSGNIVGETEIQPQIETLGGK